MSHLRHYAVLVTDSRKEVEQAHLKAQSMGLTVSAINEEPYNFQCTFCVFPHGSKENYPESVAYHVARKLFVEYLKDTSCDWVEVWYGTDEGMARISADAWDTESAQICPDCEGTGIQRGRKEKECDRCEGSGYAEW